MKKFFALFLSLVVIASTAPVALTSGSKNLSLFTECSEVTTFGNVTFNGGADALILNDGVTHDLDAYQTLATSGDYTFATARLQYFPERYATFNGADTGVTVELLEADYFNRIVIHQWNPAILNYRAEVSVDGISWDTVKMDSLPEITPRPNQAFSVFQEIAFETQYAKFIRFTVLSLGATEYYLTEIGVYSGNCVDLASSSAYTVGGFRVSSRASGSTSGTGGPIPGIWYPQVGQSQYWNVIFFYNSYDINRVILSQPADMIGEYEILYTTSDTVYNNPWAGGAPNPGWLVAASGDLGGTGTAGATDSVINFDTVTASGVMINVKTFQGTPAFQLKIYNWVDYTIPEKLNIVHIGSGDPLGDILSDGFTYNMQDYFDMVNYGGYTFESARAKYNIDKFVNFQDANSGVQFSWDGSQLVNRIDFYEWPRGAINEYKIEISGNGVNWTQVNQGTFPDMSDPGEWSFAAYHSVNFETQYAKYLRFTVLSLKSGTEYYLSEATPYNSTPPDVLGSSVYNSGGFKLSSRASGTASGTVPLKTTWYAKADQTQYWYASLFYLRQTVSRVTLIEATDAIGEYEILYSNNSGAYDNPWVDGALNPAWSIAARGDLGGTGTLSNKTSYIDFPAIQARYWMLNIKDWAATPAVQMKMYNWFDPGETLISEPAREGGSVSAEVIVINSANTAATINVVAAVYENNTLKTVKRMKIDILNALCADIAEISVSGVACGDTVKIFVWEANTLRSLCKNEISNPV